MHLDTRTGYSSISEARIGYYSKNNFGLKNGEQHNQMQT